MSLFHLFLISLLVFATPLLAGLGNGRIIYIQFEQPPAPKDTEDILAQLTRANEFTCNAFGVHATQIEKVVFLLDKKSKIDADILYLNGRNHMDTSWVPIIQDNTSEFGIPGVHATLYANETVRGDQWAGLLNQLLLGNPHAQNETKNFIGTYEISQACSSKPCLDSNSCEKNEYCDPIFKPAIEQNIQELCYRGNTNIKQPSALILRDEPFDLLVIVDASERMLKRFSAQVPSPTKYEVAKVIVSTLVEQQTRFGLKNIRLSFVNDLEMPTIHPSTNRTGLAPCHDYYPENFYALWPPESVRSNYYYWKPDKTLRVYDNRCYPGAYGSRQCCCIVGEKLTLSSTPRLFDAIPGGNATLAEAMQLIIQHNSPLTLTRVLLISSGKLSLGEGFQEKLDQIIKDKSAMISTIIMDESHEITEELVAISEKTGGTLQIVAKQEEGPKAAILSLIHFVSAHILMQKDFSVKKDTEFLFPIKVQKNGMSITACIFRGNYKSKNQTETIVVNDPDGRSFLNQQLTEGYLCFDVDDLTKGQWSMLIGHHRDPGSILVTTIEDELESGIFLAYKKNTSHGNSLIFTVISGRKMETQAINSIRLKIQPLSGYPINLDLFSSSSHSGLLTGEVPIQAIQSPDEYSAWIDDIVFAAGFDRVVPGFLNQFVTLFFPRSHSTKQYPILPRNKTFFQGSVRTMFPGCLPKDPMTVTSGVDQMKALTGLVLTCFATFLGVLFNF